MIIDVFLICFIKLLVILFMMLIKNNKFCKLKLICIDKVFKIFVLNCC